MKLESTFPKKLEQAKKDRIPLVIPLGVIEYHGPQNGQGCDTLVIQGLLERLERENPERMVLAPTFWYGPSTYCVAAPGLGTSIDVDCLTFQQLFGQIFTSLLRNNWRNIYVAYWHQSETDLQMALAIKAAASSAIFRYMESDFGEGWWGDKSNSKFYSYMDEGDHYWNWIKVIKPFEDEFFTKFGFDHAGKWETSLLMGIKPEAVDLAQLEDSDDAWYTADSREADAGLGARMRDYMLDNLRGKIV